MRGAAKVGAQHARRAWGAAMVRAEHAWRTRGATTSLALALLLGLACGAPAAPGPSAAPLASGAPAAAAPAAPPTPAPVALKFHVPSRSTSYLPWYIAIERGYFREQNLDVELLQIAATTG